MGGFGALSYAARHPDLFVHVAGFSPASDTNYGPFIFLQESGTSDGDPTVNIWGERTTQEVRWRGHNPWDLAQNYRGMDVSLRYGTGDPGGPFGGGDPIEAGVHAMTVGFDAKLTTLGIPHVNDDYGPGGHTWPYWQRDLVEELPLIMHSFRNPPRRPVTYKTIDPAYEVFGWRVSIQRPALEFSLLRNATRRGFELSGSGSATVTTPARYRPREQLKVRVCTDSGACRGQGVSASAGGRLRIAVPLGPGNSDQEYTTQAGLDGGTRVFTTRVRIKR
jgi:hypothetical protein